MTKTKKFNPFYRTKLGEMVQGDSVEILRARKANTVDLIMTSPPWNKGTTSHRTTKRPMCWRCSLEAGDAKIKKLPVRREQVALETSTRKYLHATTHPEWIIARQLSYT